MHLPLGLGRSGLLGSTGFHRGHCLINPAFLWRLRYIEVIFQIRRSFVLVVGISSTFSRSFRLSLDSIYQAQEICCALIDVFPSELFSVRRCAGITAPSANEDFAMVF